MTDLGIRVIGKHVNELLIEIPFTVVYVLFRNGKYTSIRNMCYLDAWEEALVPFPEGA